MTRPVSEHLTSGSEEKQTHTSALRTSLQQEDRLLRAEEQGIIDQGARTAIHIREQEVQRDIPGIALTTRALKGCFMVCGKELLTSFGS
jgi:hypothetical protein